MTEPLLIRCLQCEAINRIRLLTSDSSPVCGRCKAVLEMRASPTHVTAQNFQREVLNWPGLVLADFWADWCAPCRALAPVLESLSREKVGHLKIVKIDTESEPELASRYSIRAIPTLLLFRKGALVDRQSGALSKAQLTNWIETMAPGYVISETTTH